MVVAKARPPVTPHTHTCTQKFDSDSTSRPSSSFGTAHIHFRTDGQQRHRASVATAASCPPPRLETTDHVYLSARRRPGSTQLFRTASHPTPPAPPSTQCRPSRLELKNHSFVLQGQSEQGNQFIHPIPHAGLCPSRAKSTFGLCRLLTAHLGVTPGLKKKCTHLA